MPERTRVQSVFFIGGAILTIGCVALARGYNRIGLVIVLLAVVIMVGTFAVDGVWSLVQWIKSRRSQPGGFEVNVGSSADRNES